MRVRKPADRLRNLSRNVLLTSENDVAQTALNEEAERRLLAVFVNGLRGNPGL